MSKAKESVLKGVSFVMIFTILVLIVWCSQVLAQRSYPTRTMDIICPFPAGGLFDVNARLVASYCSKKWEVPINVINKPGGSTVPSTLEVYNSAPDGYTMLQDGTGSTTTVHFAVKDLPYKILDRTFIGTTALTPHILIVPLNSPCKNLEDLATEIKKDPNNFTWGSQGASGGTDIVLRMFLKQIGIDIKRTKPVMIRGGSEGATLVAGGNIKFTVVSVATAQGITKGGLVRVLAVTVKERVSQFPDVPTTAELGYPMVSFKPWVGISGGPNLPSYVVDRWEKGLQEMSKDSEALSKMRRMGLVPFFLNGSATKEYLIKEIQAYEEIW